ncbi:MAG: type II secretion system GspH family protein [Candidatus Omnitrophica bacterium]|nr:type II secretion system GspH family protein [Candidatus Omnitrophota bacterium]MDO9573339.1 type II secretion system protein [Candidatus Omnitrophota bacterium]
MMWLTGVNDSRALPVLRGFTLVELMVSVLILGIGLTSVANSYILALRGANSVQNNISALILAKEKFENLEFASLKGAKPSFPAPEIIKSSNKDYNYQQEITKLPESDVLAKYLVSACSTINWPEKNSLKNVTLATYLLLLKEK